MTASQLDIVIPVFNGWFQTKRCLDSLRASENLSARIIVVNHGSTDETDDALLNDYPEVIHLHGDSSLWWTGATNLGIRWAIDHGSTTVMLLNNDCYFPPGAIDCLMSYSTENPAAIIAPVQRNHQTNEILVSYARSLFLLGFPTLVLPGSRSIKTETRKLIPTKLILGGRGVIIPDAIFDSVCLFNEAELPHYGADHDFYIRCRKAGYPLYIAADCSIYVDSERTTLGAASDDLSFSALTRALYSRRSHRNIHDLVALFRLHYPIKHLYFIGVALNVIRYVLVSIWHRLWRTITLK